MRAYRVPESGENQKYLVNVFTGLASTMNDGGSCAVYLEGFAGINLSADGTKQIGYCDGAQLSVLHPGPA